MRLDASYLHFISRQEMRILAAIEMGMRNHEYVSAELITKIGNLRGGQTFKTIQKLLKNKFITHIGNKCDGYKLTYLGYDYLALQAFIKRGLIKQVLGKIGVGKQSDIYKCVTPQGDFCVLKLTRLGRNSFRSIKKNREYIQHRTNYNWLYLSRLSSIRQFLFMQMLHSSGFPTPKPIDVNRHAILMSLVDGDTFCHIQRITSQAEIKKLFQMTLELLTKFAKNGLIHGDFNQFNLMVNQDGTKLTIIDFPQCVSVKHPNAQFYFDRDVECIYTYFEKLSQKSYEENVRLKEQGDMSKEVRLNVEDYPMPNLDNIEVERRLDHQIKIKGHITMEEYNQLEQYRSEEDRMKAEMDKHREEQKEEEMEAGEEGEEEDQKEEGEKQSQEDLQNEEKELKQLQLKNQMERAKIEEIQNIDKIQTIETIQKKKELHKYDEQLQNLINDLGDDFNLQNKLPQAEKQENDDDSSQEEQRFKGLTPYEIRIKIKEQKRIQREKRKQAVNTEDYIKKALKKGGSNNRKPMAGKGNHGTKNKVKQTNQQIKDTFFS